MRAVLVLTPLLLCLHCSAPASDSPSAPPAPASAPTAPAVDAAAPADASASKPSPSACSPTDPRRTAVELAVLPDQGEQPYVALLTSAQTSIRVLGYEMGYGAILDTLSAKARAGVDVKVILDGVTQRDVNDKYRVILEAAGAEFEWSDPNFSYMHAKTMVVDDRAAIVSTGNYSKTYILKERNYVATITDPQDVSDLAALFDADWKMTSPDLSCTRLLVSPVNSRDRLLELIASAKTTLLVESMQYDDTAVVAAILARKAAGVKVRVLLAAPSWITANQAAGTVLTSRNGIPARWLAAPVVHVKSILVDGARAYVGSENISYTSLSDNREVGIVLEDAPALASMNTTFESDWALATSF